MADLHRSFPNPNQPTGFLVPILEEAKHRWLRPAEIIEIIRSYQKIRLKPEPPNLPPAGSIFLFDRKVLRYFRKDGYRWRKKKDGKTVKEAHEKLKSGSVDVLHCYYAHGEDNESFQRRSYWMLEGQLEHIVLVHYREVKEGYKTVISRLQPSPIKIESPQSSSTPRSTQKNLPAPTLQTPLATNSRRVDWNPQPSSSQYEDADLGDNSGGPSSTQPLYASTALSPSPFSHGIEGFTDTAMNPFGSLQPRSQFYNYNLPGSSSDWTGAQGSTTSDNDMHDQEFRPSQPVGANFITHKLSGAEFDAGHNVHESGSDRLINVHDTHVAEMAPERDFQVAQNYDFDMGIPTLQKSSGPQTAVTFTDQVQRSNKEVPPLKNEVADLKKLDSFGRWMNVAMGDDCGDSLMASSSGNYWNPLSGENDAKEASSLSHHIPLDMVSLEPSLSQEQLFSITDFSPDWAYASVGTKVLIVGRFMGDNKKYSDETKWGCMFGEIEVPAEVAVDNVLRCLTPLHAPGRVPFYVTRSNRLACSEVREFKFLEIPRQTTTNCLPEEELRLQIRLGKLLHLGPERQFINCRADDCDKCKIGKTIQSMKIDGVGDGEMSSRDSLIQYLVADRLCEWLVYKVHEGGNDGGQGVIHLAACLGYHWAISPIVSAGVSSNFRDAHGRTGLHWASYFGREETVLELVRLGASPGALEDPTSEFPGGRTAADLASCHGHKGIAGYLAEADLKTQLFQLKIGENISTDDPTEATDDQSMKGSLAAVRKSALAASLIQDAFRKRSLRHGQLTNRIDDTNPDDSHTVATMGGLNTGQRFGHFEDSLHSAAKSIQKKYRGFRGRSDFLDLRSHVVKIQAHVRGHQVRKHYRNLVWSVSIMEKVILRWRRKGHGLRGFRLETVKEAATGNKKGDEYEFLDVGRKQKSDAVDKAFERVKSMVRHPEAREQYMRLVSRSQNMEMGSEGTSGSLDVNSSKMSATEQDLPQFPIDQ